MRHNTLAEIRGRRDSTHHEDSIPRADLSDKTPANSNIEVQMKLEDKAPGIRFHMDQTIDVTKYTHLFGHQIYDGYRPQTLAQTRDYL